MGSYYRGSGMLSGSQQSFPNAKYAEPHIIECSDSKASVEKWLSDAISTEVSRGNKLRAAKLKGTRFISQLDAIDIRLPKHKKLNRTKRSSPYKMHSKTNSCSPLCDRPLKPRHRSRKGSPTRTYPMSGNDIYSPTSYKRNIKIIKPKTKCTMRIAELAAPTKRHCIETWRHRSNLLPYYMIDRLRLQSVEPRIVELPEAIEYFQTSKQVNKRSREVKDTKFSLKTSMIEARNLCTLLARKINKKLRWPFNKILSPDLENFTNVIFDDITKLGIRKKMPVEKNIEKEIQRDVCRKIVIWIVGILHDSNLNQLEEELRVKRIKEGVEARSGQLITVIENVLVKEKKNESEELEEEEGPALDAMDDLVENVLNICQPFHEEHYVLSESLGYGCEKESLKVDSQKELLTASEVISSIPTNFISHIEDKYLKTVTESQKDDSQNELLTSSEVISSILTNFISSIEDKYLTAVTESRKDDSQNELLTSSKVISSILTNYISSIEDKYISAENEIELNNIRNEMYDLVETILTSNAFPENKYAADIIDQIEKDLENDDVFQSNFHDDSSSEHLNDFASVSSEHQKDFASVSSEHLKDFASALSEQTKDLENNADFVYDYQEDFKTKDVEVNTLGDSEHESTKHWINNELNNILHKISQETTLEKKDSKFGFFEGSENSSKKVKFLIKRMVKDLEDTKLESTSLQLQLASYTDLLFNKTFSEPNLHLLSNADEVWPPEMNRLKPSFSVSRSITSLGKIAEMCELQYLIDVNENIGTSINSDSQSIKDKIIPTPENEINPVSSTSAVYTTKDTYIHKVYTDDNFIFPTNGGGTENVDYEIGTSTATHETEKYREDLVQDQFYNTDTNVVVIKSKEKTSKINEIVHNITEPLSEMINIQDKERDINENVIEHNREHPSSSYNVMTEPKESLVEDTTFTQDIDKISVQIPDLLINMISEEMATDQFKTKERKLKSSRKHSKNKLHRISSGDQTRAERKSSTTQAKVKYEWKVQPSAAPSWLARAQGDSDESLPSRRTGTYTLTTLDAEKWCQDLDKAFMNLELWNDWLKNTRIEISGLRKKRECLCDSLRRKDVNSWAQLKRNIDKDAMVWRKLYQRTQERFQCFDFVGMETAHQPYSNYMNARQKQKMSSKCQCSNLSNKTNK